MNYEDRVFEMFLQSYRDKLATLPAPPPGFYYTPEIRDIKIEGEDYIIKSEFLLKPIIEHETMEQTKMQGNQEISCGNVDAGTEYDKGYRAGHRYGLRQTEDYTIGRTFKGLIPCWINAPSTLQPAHKWHGKNVVVMHENNGGFRCVCIDDENPVTFHLPEGTLFVEGWRKNNG